MRRTSCFWTAGASAWLRGSTHSISWTRAGPEALEDCPCAARQTRTCLLHPETRGSGRTPAKLVRDSICAEGGRSTTSVDVLSAVRGRPQCQNVGLCSCVTQGSATGRASRVSSAIAEVLSSAHVNVAGRHVCERKGKGDISAPADALDAAQASVAHACCAWGVTMILSDWHLL